MTENAAVIPLTPKARNGGPKALYELGETPPLGHLPDKMYAWAIRRERHGPPDQSMQVEVVPTPEPEADEVVVMVMAAGVNYNGVWAGLGLPISPFDVHKQPFHIAGSDASGIVWATSSVSWATDLSPASWRLCLAVPSPCGPWQTAQRVL